MERFKVIINILAVTCVIGLAISYASQLLSAIPDLNFLESVGIYAIWTPIHHGFNSINKSNN
jgi:hypothetical protein